MLTRDGGTEGGLSPSTFWLKPLTFATTWARARNGPERTGTPFQFVISIDVSVPSREKFKKPFRLVTCVW